MSKRRQRNPRVTGRNITLAEGKLRMMGMSAEAWENGLAALEATGHITITRSSDGEVVNVVLNIDRGTSARTHGRRS
jgi:hypothetical protein